MKNSSQNYYPFLAIAAVFVTFAFLQGVTVQNSLKQRKQLRAADTELQKMVPQALTINETVENLGNDLMSMTNREARQIVADFKIAPSPQTK